VRTLLYAGGVLILAYGALCTLLYALQDWLIYHPTRDVSPPGAHAVLLKSNDAILKLWELHPQQPAAVLYFGGNAEDVSASLPDFAAAFPDRAVYLVNYRGYGGSTGRPSEGALIADAEAIFDWVAARHRRVAVIGRSLGSGIATALAASRPIERLVLVTPYDSIANVAAAHFPWFPVRWLLKDRYDSSRRVGEVRAPVLALVAERDEVVPRARSDALIAAIPARLRHAVVLTGATHNDISTYPAYLANLRDFLAGHSPSGS
jgi:pimeloyl-ACP methyl ester carboxylesterase